MGGFLEHLPALGGWFLAGLVWFFLRGKKTVEAIFEENASQNRKLERMESLLRAWGIDSTPNPTKARAAPLLPEEITKTGRG